MFFNAQSRNASNIAETLNALLKKCFERTMFEAALMANLMPRQLVEDAYILGFFISSGSTINNHVLNKSIPSREKRDEFSLLFLKKFFKNEYTIALELGDIYSRKESVRFHEFSRGCEDAVSFVGVSYGLLRADDQSAIVQEARVVAAKIGKEFSSAGVDHNEQGDLTAAVTILTLLKHVRRYYS